MPATLSLAANDYFIGANLTVYFSLQQLKNRDFRGPDFFLVRNVDNSPNSYTFANPFQYEENPSNPVVITPLDQEDQTTPACPDP